MQDLTLANTTPVDTAEPVRLTDEERQPCEVWTRVMGYHRPVASFNTGKKGEFAERRHFEEAGARVGANQT
ncbi:MAG: anaerobic ribonucleoside-triphosphate reductase [Rubrivivax sp.]|nr:anaerobic ribonucleoside-triphosphate reductase [Rubrivivax sp.]MDP3614412.1 anaerobic ribonucleoside-triphosphate reductase [Rubrivivax sp.]